MNTPVGSRMTSTAFSSPVKWPAISTGASPAAEDAIEDILAATSPATVLGIAKDATGRDARDAFLAASRLVHPDVCADDRAGANYVLLSSSSSGSGSEVE